MKRVLSLFMILLLAISLFACGQNEKENVPTVSIPATPKQIDSEQTTTEQSSHVVSPYKKIIDVRGLDELETLKQMLNDNVDAYEMNKKFGMLATHTDYKRFLAMYSAFPRLNLMEGEITWICQYDDDVLRVATKNENEEWFRVEYQLKATDVSELKHFRVDLALLDKPVNSKDGRLKVYGEVRKVREDGMEVITWSAELDNMPIYIVYCANNSPTVTAKSLFSELTVQDPVVSEK